MQKVFGQRVTAKTLADCDGGIIQLDEKSISIVDEVDDAFLDRGYKLEGKGLLLGLTATGLRLAKP